MTQQEIDQAIKDQIGADPASPVPSNPNIATALASSAAEMAKVADAFNKNETDVFNDAFKNWSDQVLAGKIPNTNPPLPPPKYEGVAATDGWSYVIRTAEPVVAMPPLPQVPVAPEGISVGVHQGGAFWQSLGGRFPQGFITPTTVTSKDGKVGFFRYAASPFGGWWELVG